MSNENIKIAIQKQGRLFSSSIELLENIGLELANGNKDKLVTPCRNFPLSIVYLRDDDIPKYVQEGVADLGIVGKNIVEEKKAQVKILEELRFGYCRLCLAIDQNSTVKDLKDLQGKKIATSYPNLLTDYLKKKNIKANIIELKGSVELAPGLKIADAICDLVSSGNTLRNNNLRVFSTILKSEAVLIANKKALIKKNEIIDKLLMRIKAVLKAQQIKYVLMNAPEEAVEDIIRVVPGMKSPTIVPLNEKGFVAIHSVVPEAIFWQVIEKLKKAGARDILILSIEKIIS